MDSYNNEPSLFDPLTLVDPYAQPSQQQSNIQSGGPAIGPVPGTNPAIGPMPTGTTGLNPDNFLDQIIGNIPGVGQLVALLDVVKKVLGEVNQGITEAGKFPLLGFIESHLALVGSLDKILQIDSNKLWDWIRANSFDQFFESYLRDGLGVHPENWDTGAKDAIKTVDSMLGFAVLTQFIGGAINTVGEALLANRWSSTVGSLIGTLPEEMGLSWALGLTIDETFKSALGSAMEEAINVEKRSNRIQWPQIRQLLKQHVLDEPTFYDLMTKQGFPDEQITYLKKLQDAQLQLGDISQLWYRGEFSDSDAKTHIRTLGFTDDDADKLFTMYMDKAENSASVLYRTVARQMFLAHIIAEDQYRSVLGQAHYPQKLIDEDVAAVQLEQSLGKVMQSVSVIKTRYQHNAINGDEARTELHELNYTDSYINELLQAWDLPPLRRQHGLSQAKILSYMVSGVIQPAQATTMLQALGLTQDAVELLIAHPTANGSTKLHKVTPGLITQAYLDGVIQPSELKQAFLDANVDPSAVQTYVDVAHYRFTHKKGSGSGDIPLSEGQIREAFKYGIMDESTALHGLEMIGYSADNAMLILEIVNKGPIQPPVPPIFANLQQAIAYMEANGYAVFNPPPPQLLAAESMLASAGYTYAKTGTINPPNIPPTIPPVGTVGP